MLARIGLQEKLISELENKTTPTQQLQPPSQEMERQKRENDRLQQELKKTNQHLQQLQTKVQHLENETRQQFARFQNTIDKQVDNNQSVHAHCNHLENTVIQSLLDRIESLEGAVQAVERLWVVSREEIKISDTILGTGGWGCVKVAFYRGRRVAAKVMHRNIVSPHYKGLFEKEMKISARCMHRNLLEFIGAVPDDPAIILTEVMDTDLREGLTKGNVAPNHIYSISMDVSAGLLYLHSIRPHPLIHRDVSAPNILLKFVEGTGWIAKLSDFGSAQFTHLAQTVGPGCFVYSAPEVRQESTAYMQTVKIDVYSYGVLLIEMLTREIPIGNLDALLRSIWSRWPRCSSLINRCVSYDPSQRPSMKQVIDELNAIRYELR